MHNFADDERVRILNEKIQGERDTKKLIALINELKHLLDEHLQPRKPGSSAGKLKLDAE